MRLIDADNLKSVLNSGGGESVDIKINKSMSLGVIVDTVIQAYRKCLFAELEKSPTAYDVDKVIDRINIIFQHHRATKTVQRLVVETITSDMDESGATEKVLKEWIPSEEPPESGEYVLLSFENFAIPLVGRYEVDDEGGGAYYVGDDEESCINQDIIVNAWMTLPESYKN